MPYRPLRPLALLALLPLVGAAPPSQRLPDRLLKCTLGRATNLDPKREQTTAEIVYDGRHPFELFLPGIPARTAPPPDATDAPEPAIPAPASSPTRTD